MLIPFLQRSDSTLRPMFQVAYRPMKLGLKSPYFLGFWVSLFSHQIARIGSFCSMAVFEHRRSYLSTALEVGLDRYRYDLGIMEAK